MVTVQDRGRGFDPSAEPATTEPHFGLFSIRERMEAVGGTLSLTSVPGEGTTAKLSFVHRPQPDRPTSKTDTGHPVMVDRAITDSISARPHGG